MTLTTTLLQDYQSIQSQSSNDIEQGLVRQVGSLNGRLVRSYIEKEIQATASKIVQRTGCRGTYPVARSIDRSKADTHYIRHYIATITCMSVLADTAVFAEGSTKIGPKIVLAIFTPALVTILAFTVSIELNPYLFRIKEGAKLQNKIDRLNHALDQFPNTENAAVFPEQLIDLLEKFKLENESDLLSELSVEDFQLIVGELRNREIDLELKGAAAALEQLLFNPPKDENRYLELHLRAAALIHTEADYEIIRNTLPVHDPRREHVHPHSEPSPIQEKSEEKRDKTEQITIQIADRSLQIDFKLLKKHSRWFEACETASFAKSTLKNPQHAKTLIKILEQDYDQLLAGIETVERDEWFTLLDCAIYYQFEEIIGRLVLQIGRISPSFDKQKEAIATLIMTDHFTKNNSAYIYSILKLLKNTTDTIELNQLLDILNQPRAQHIVAAYYGTLIQMETIPPHIMVAIHNRPNLFSTMVSKIEENLRQMLKQNIALQQCQLNDPDFINWFAERLQDPASQFLTTQNYRDLYINYASNKYPEIKEAIRAFTHASPNTALAGWNNGETPIEVLQWIKEARST